MINQCKFTVKLIYIYKTNRKIRGESVENCGWGRVRHFQQMMLDGLEWHHLAFLVDTLSCNSSVQSVCFCVLSLCCLKLATEALTGKYGEKIKLFEFRKFAQCTGTICESPFKGKENGKTIIRPSISYTLYY